IRAGGSGGVRAQECGGTVEPGHVGEIGPQGPQRLGEGGSAGEVEMLRDGKQIPGPRAGTLGVTPAVDQGCNVVAHGPAGHIGADLADGPGHFQAGPGGGSGWGRVEALELQQVGSVHAGGGDVDDDFVGDGLGVGYVGRRTDDVVGDELCAHVAWYGYWWVVCGAEKRRLGAEADKE